MGAVQGSGKRVGLDNFQVVYLDILFDLGSAEVVGFLMDWF